MIQIKFVVEEETNGFKPIMQLKKDPKEENGGIEMPLRIFAFV